MADIIFHNERFFYAAYEEDAEVVNEVFGYKIYMAGDRKKAAFPVNLAGWVKYVLTEKGYECLFVGKEGKVYNIEAREEKTANSTKKQVAKKVSIKDLYKLGPWRRYEVAFNDDGELVTDLELLIELRKFRNLKAFELNVVPTSIFNNEALVYFATIKPSTIEELNSLKGFSEDKINTFGQELIDFIGNYKFEGHELLDNNIDENKNVIPEKEEEKKPIENKSNELEWDLPY